VQGVESTPVQLSVFWSEKEKSDMVLIKDQLSLLIANKV